MTRHPEKAKLIVETLQKSLQTSLSEGDIHQKWNHLKGAIYNCALDVCGKKQRMPQDDFEKHSSELNTVFGENEQHS